MWYYTKAIKCYKEASSFINQYAKNNLGIIFKKGFGNEIKENIGFSLVYFEEAISQKNDVLAIYNISHIYIYQNCIEDGLIKSISLLIKSYSKRFPYLKDLLCIALIKKHGFNIERIKEEFSNHINETDDLKSSIVSNINNGQLFDVSHFDNFYKYFQSIDFIYDFDYKIIQSNDFK